jgi:hypothetical protein
MKIISILILISVYSVSFSQTTSNDTISEKEIIDLAKQLNIQEKVVYNDSLIERVKLLTLNKTKEEVINLLNTYKVEKKEIETNIQNEAATIPISEIEIIELVKLFKLEDVFLHDTVLKKEFNMLINLDKRLVEGFIKFHAETKETNQNTLFFIEEIKNFNSLEEIYLHSKTSTYYQKIKKYTYLFIDDDSYSNYKDKHGDMMVLYGINDQGMVALFLTDELDVFESYSDKLTLINKKEIFAKHPEMKMRYENYLKEK